MRTAFSEQSEELRISATLARAVPTVVLDILNESEKVEVWYFLALYYTCGLRTSMMLATQAKAIILVPLGDFLANPCKGSLGT